MVWSVVQNLQTIPKAFDLWFEEFMTFWRGFPNSPGFEENLMNLFARLARDNIGHIDWSEFAPMLFSRLLAHFKLPVHFR